MELSPSLADEPIRFGNLFKQRQGHSKVKRLQQFFFFFFCRPDRSHVTSSFVYGLILVRVWRLSLSLIKLDISFHCRLIFKRNKQFLCSHLDVPTLCPPSPHTHTIQPLQHLMGFFLFFFPPTSQLKLKCSFYPLIVLSFQSRMLFTTGTDNKSQGKFYLSVYCAKLCLD